MDSHSIAIKSAAGDLATRFKIDFGDGDPATALIAQLGMGGASAKEILQMFIVCREHGLNPMTKEIYAFPQGDKLQPLIGFDGWIRIANSNPQYDGHTFHFTNAEDGAPISCRCTMHRKDRSHPVEVEEFYSENFMPRSPVWKQRPRRMLMIRALAQAVRQSFGVSGIGHDMTPEEAQEEVRTVDAQVKVKEQAAAIIPSEEAMASIEADLSAGEITAEDDPEFFGMPREAVEETA